MFDVAGAGRERCRCLCSWLRAATVAVAVAVAVAFEVAVAVAVKPVRWRHVASAEIGKRSVRCLSVASFGRFPISVLAACAVRAADRHRRVAFSCLLLLAMRDYSALASRKKSMKIKELGVDSL